MRAGIWAIPFMLAAAGQMRRLAKIVGASGGGEETSSAKGLCTSALLQTESLPGGSQPGEPVGHLLVKDMRLGVRRSHKSLCGMVENNKR